MDRWERNMVSYQEAFTAFRGGPLANFSQDSPTQPAPPRANGAACHRAVVPHYHQ